MPNWCECELTVSAPREGYKNHFRDSVRGGENPIDVNKILPYPDHYRRLDESVQIMRENGVDWRDIPKDGFNSGGYEWCVANWGTKWGLCDVFIVKETPRTIKYEFNTAWSPPIALIKKAAEQHPRCTFTLKYWEGGMCFKGTFQIRGDRVLRDIEEKYYGSRGG